jgi:ubiquinone/menaquinone biosynthesis C-methylase UbiE
MIDNLKVVEHYSPHGLVKMLQSALAQSGLQNSIVPVEKLAMLDQFHVLGFQATVELAALCNISPQTKVLDIGSGLGGASRYLAKNFGCHVTGIDLSPEFVEASRYLTRRTGLEANAKFEVADAINMPFENETFDLAWTQHVAMNIEDRSALYAEIRRILKPDGRLAIFDIVKGKNDEIVFPMPWAATKATSFLLGFEEMQKVLLEAHFEIIHWKDKTAEALEWMQQQNAQMNQQTSLPSLSLPAIMGKEFMKAGANMVSALKEGRAGLVQAIVSNKHT